MARKARQRVSYVLPLPNSPGGHRLGVNSLALDQRGVLYTAGRDGALCSWNLHTDLTRNKSIHDNFQFTNDNLPNPTPRPKPPASSFQSQVQAHTHWVNDIALTADSESLVSCSSDLTVKLWRPNTRETPATIGLHSDYVKCLVTPGRDSGAGNWVASGGLDRKIHIWDLSGKGEQLEIDVGDEGSNPKGSVYSLGVGGGILASGGPEGVVRVWDPRSGKPITKFVGHTDLVRSILVSEQGNTILSASSDATIKVWSMTGGRCLHTLTMHNDSVWSLHSSHPSLEIFHSSDRSGLVAKTDIRNVAEIDEGICVAVCQENEGVGKVIGDGGLGAYIWTATSSSCIHRWLDANTDLDIAPKTAPLNNNSPPDPYGHHHRPSNASTLSRFPSQPAKSGPTIPINSLLRLSAASSFGLAQNTRDPDAVTVYSMPRNRQASITEAILSTEDSGNIKPIYERPDETIEGQNGLIKHVLLNDRRRVLTLDTAGDVVEWDLVKCSVIKSWGKKHLEDVTPIVNTLDSVANWCQVDTRTGRLACVLEENYCFDAEMYADEVAADEKIEFRDDQRINLGKWVLRYIFSNLIDEEIRRDEEFRKRLVTAKSPSRTKRANAPPTITLPTTPGVGNWTDKHQTPTTPRAGVNGMHHNVTTPGMNIGLATPLVTNFPKMTGGSEDGYGHLATMAEEDSTNIRNSQEKHDYFSPPTPNTGTDEPRTPGTNLTTVPTANQSSVVAPPETPSGSKLSFGKLWGKKANRNSTSDEKRPVIDENGPKPENPDAESAKPIEVFDETLGGVLKRMRQEYASGSGVGDGTIKTMICPSLPNETPVLKHPSEMVVIIQEDKPDSGGAKDMYRGTVGHLGVEADELEKVLPAWVAEAILFNRIPLKEVVKVSFVLYPWHDILPAISNANDINSRLNANRMLRAKKIMAYIAEKMDPLPEQAIIEETDRMTPPEEWLELLCKDEILPLDITLATLRAHVWKTGGDVVLHYRMKGNITPIVRKKKEKVRESLVPGQPTYVPAPPANAAGTNNSNGGGNVNGIGEERDELRGEAM